MNSSNDPVDVESHLNHQRWLINNGFLNDMHKNTLYFYGSITHRDVQALQLSVDVATKTVEYDLYLSNRLVKVLSRYKHLKGKNSIWSLWRLRRLLSREGNLEFNAILNNFVKSYCGLDWKEKAV
jgi:hypothetical protein